MFLCLKITHSILISKINKFLKYSKLKSDYIRKMNI